MHILRNVLLCCLIILGCNGCWKDRFQDEFRFYEVAIKVEYPDNYNISSAQGVEVCLRNVNTNLSSIVKSDEKGYCFFSNIPSGLYSVMASKVLGGDQAIALGDTLLKKGENTKKVNLTSTIGEIKISDELETEVYNLRLMASVPGDILFKEVYYSGSRTINGKAYQNDHFVELYNNSDQEIYLDGLLIGSVYGGNGSPKTLPSIFKRDKDNVYLTAAWQIPGKGTDNGLMPGESIVIAQDGVNHADALKKRGVDLSCADWEIFVSRPDKQRDIDVIDVPNLVEDFMTYKHAFDWIFNSHGESLVLYRKGEEGEELVVGHPGNSGKELLKIPSNWVLDAFESLDGPSSGEFKRIPSLLDLGYVFCPEIYSGYSCRRKIWEIIEGRRILKDTNNSGEDFEILAFPTPKSFD